MHFQGKDILHSNFTYNPEIYYFLYVGDLKAYSLNSFVKEALERRISNRKIQFIAIIPDVCIQYNYTNIIVINPTASKEMLEDHSFDQSNKPPKNSSRIDSASFMTAVSNNETIHTLIHAILENQNQLYVNLYESMREMTLDTIDRVSILGPDKHIAHKYNNKIVQRNELEGAVPFIEGFCSDSLEDVIQKLDRLWSTWNDGVFISAAYSAAGANSAIVSSSQQIRDKFTEEKSEYLVTRYHPHELDPTVLAVVANENDVYIAGVADQVIVDGNKFVGSKFPSVISDKNKALLHEYTVEVGKVMGKAGYRGIFGCDYMIDFEDSIYFLEINARKQGTTVEFCFTLEQTLPEGSPSLPELEYYAVLENRFPPHTTEMNGNIRNIHWGTYNYKIKEDILTTGYIPQNPYERETFKKVARKELLKDFVILEHLGTNLQVTPGTFLARIVSVAKTREGVDEGLCQGFGFIEQTFTEAIRN